jgi:hypothetical protein
MSPAVAVDGVLMQPQSQEEVATQEPGHDKPDAPDGLSPWLTFVVNFIPGQQAVKGALAKLSLAVMVMALRFSMPRILAIRTAFGKDLTIALKR